MLSPSLAQEIAADTTAVIGHNVLITDRDGIVIGSGDPARVGSFHEASVAVIRDLEPAAHDAGQASLLRGVRPGITLPLVLEGAGVGTVGITGSPGQVSRFGLVVKRQIEILLREAVTTRSRALRERALEDLLADLASYDPNLVEPGLILFRGAELGCNLALRRVVVVLELGTLPASEAGHRDRHGPAQHGPAHRIPVLRPEILRTLREVFSDPQDLVTSLVASGRFAVLHRIKPDAARHDAEAATIALCNRLADLLRSQLGLAAQVALAGPAASVADLHDAYQDACDVLRLGPRVSPDKRVHTVSDLRAHQLLATVSHRTRAHLIDTVTGELRDHNDWPTLRTTIIAWCDNGFNQVRTAEALHIHRNTLVYRLNRIEQLSGRPLRSPRAGVTLYLAALADQLEALR
ncbi:CdaR family transcriptional regulator [Catenulispora rubra]|uniref:CdaR family transcriptional regulator n=1 Tax=Catenulispora rubra TaxID=280293 RepID=UPI0018920438|nr:sugar diacid recognition domain-containing protein [Catenulispora rubra]